MVTMMAAVQTRVNRMMITPIACLLKIQTQLFLHKGVFVHCASHNILSSAVFMVRDTKATSFVLAVTAGCI